jgi:hypothetical protein
MYKSDFVPSVFKRAVSATIAPQIAVEGIYKRQRFKGPMILCERSDMESAPVKGHLMGSKICSVFRLIVLW